MNKHYPSPQDLEDDGCECPTCLRPMQDEIDYECGTCEAKASEHLSVTTLCNLLRETQRRESCLIAENYRIKKQLEDAKATADFWIQKNKHDNKAAIAVVTELIDTRQHWRDKFASERALADRLADALISTDAIIRKEVSLIGQWDSPVIFKEALAAWKEARSE